MLPHRRAGGFENNRCIAILCSIAWQKEGNQADKHGHGNDQGFLQFVESSKQRDYDKRDQGDDDHRIDNGPGDGGRDAIKIAKLATK